LEVIEMVKITKAAAQAMLAEVPEEKRFWCHDGRYLKNLEELKDALEQMADEIFSYHSNAEKTDFSNWVKDVIGDEKLSGDLLKCTTRAESATVVAARVKYLKSRV
jgi:SpoU rRNA methylase family enzyme